MLFQLSVITYQIIDKIHEIGLYLVNLMIRTFEVKRI